MANTGSIEADPLFLGLTRPAMIFGVSYLFAATNFLATIFTFIITNELSSFFIIFFVHGIGFYFSAKEPLFIELFMIRQKTCRKAQKNRLYHGNTNSYDIL